MRLVPDPVAERWLLGMTGTTKELEWDSGNLSEHRKHGVEPADIRLRPISCRPMRRKERALYEEARRQEG